MLQFHDPGKNSIRFGRTYKFCELELRLKPAVLQQKETYHICDEFFKKIFQKLLGGEQRGLVQLLLPQVIIIMHRLEGRIKEKVSAKEIKFIQWSCIYFYVSLYVRIWLII